MAINKAYLRQMRAYKKLARWADGHPIMLKVLTIAEVTTLFLFVFMYYYNHDYQTLRNEYEHLHLVYKDEGLPQCETGLFYAP